MNKKLPNTITEEEFIKLIKKVRKNHHRAAFILGFYQGMRISEVVNLKEENLRLQQHIIEIKQSKGKKDRHIPIIKPLLMGKNTVARALKEIPIRCKERALQISFRGYAKEILGRDLKFHSLRHSGSTWLLYKKKWNLHQLQTFLGHSRLDTTSIYLHTNPQELVDMEWKE